MGLPVFSSTSVTLHVSSLSACIAPHSSSVDLDLRQTFRVSCFLKFLLFLFFNISFFLCLSRFSEGL